MRLNGITVIGCDGTNVNTGHKGGIILLMELASIDHYNGEFVCFKQMSYPSVIYKILWMVQQLVLKNFVDHLVKQSKPTRPLTFKTCSSFFSISVENMPDNIDRMVLSNDQQYLYICLAISCGECYSDLALRKPGAVAHSRWLNNCK
ncbi:hypothetical protein AVEN_154465-1 [Araneus ventricosus]|uniref:Uncharacterized protein n=1 Tax=Araneus ventricosus TaxID=182803 RepID=A0A4Y2TVC9_ARAVE|nr:hypothetical protein AVEN_154465-1 [Araneus ventricosus]